MTKDYGVLECEECDLEWPDELPPLWEEGFPECPSCGGPSKLQSKLVDHARQSPRDAKRRERDSKQWKRIGTGAGAIIASNGYLMSYLFHHHP